MIIFITVSILSLFSLIPSFSPSSKYSPILRVFLDGECSSRVVSTASSDSSPKSSDAPTTSSVPDVIPSPSPFAAFSPAFVYELIMFAAVASGSINDTWNSSFAFWSSWSVICVNACTYPAPCGPMSARYCNSPWLIPLFARLSMSFAHCITPVTCDCILCKSSSVDIFDSTLYSENRFIWLFMFPETSFNILSYASRVSFDIVPISTPRLNAASPNFFNASEVCSSDLLSDISDMALSYSVSNALITVYVSAMPSYSFWTSGNASSTIWSIPSIEDSYPWI